MSRRTRWTYGRAWLRAGVLVLILLVVFARYNPLNRVLLTPDQRGRLLYEQQAFAEAAEEFADSLWKGTSFYQAGEFKQAEGLFSGFDTPDGAYNHGNTLVMQGRYKEAVPRYERALALRPGWEDAVINLEVARQGAERMKFEGGDMTGGKMGADDVVFTEGKKPLPEAGEETVEATTELDEASKRALWLRKVQTQPADFLKVKFAYQAAKPGETKP